MSQPEHNMSSHILERFCVAGINYHGADTAVRGQFAVSRDAFALLAGQAKAQNLRSVFVVSTCNRTEIYGFAENVMILVHLLLAYTKGTAEQFLQYAYLKNSHDALTHLYKVASGLDSQILGDYEILGQLKQGVDAAMEKDLIGPLMNRVVNYAFQASKKIKTDTALSSGTVSVSYAAIELLKELPAITEKKILVIGAGKFGGNVCRNLQEYLQGASVTVTNRTDETAQALALRAGIAFLPYNQLKDGISKADILVVCTNAASPTILAEYFNNDDQKLILDLSVPVNVHPDVKALPGIQLTDVDQLSATILDKTFARRKNEIPKAEAILLHYKNEFCNWLNEYRYSLHIKNWKDKLQELNEWHPQACCEMADDKQLLAEDKKVQKAVTRLAVNLRTNQEKGCQFINAINDYLQMS